MAVSLEDMRRYSLLSNLLQADRIDVRCAITLPEMEVAHVHSLAERWPSGY